MRFFLGRLTAAFPVRRPLLFLVLAGQTCMIAFDNFTSFRGVHNALPMGVSFLLLSLLVRHLNHSVRTQTLLTGTYLVVFVLFGGISGLIVPFMLMVWYEAWQRKSIAAAVPIGTISKKWAWTSVIFIGATLLSLQIFKVGFQPDFSQVIIDFGNPTSTQVLIYGGLWAIVNSFMEEFYYRGIMWNALADTGLSVSSSNVLQALLFGFGHWIFLQRVDLCLIVGLWGWMLGLIRKGTGGYLCVFLVHLIADFAVIDFMFFP